MSDETYKMFRIEWSAWPRKARIPSYGTLHLPAKDEDDARRACADRWPTMRIENIRVVSS